MKYAFSIVVFALALTYGICGSLFNIENRAIHADESEQASTFLKLYRDGEYRYNPNGPHGPTLYYWANTVEKLTNCTAPETLQIERLRKIMLVMSVIAVVSFLMILPDMSLCACLLSSAVFVCTSLAQIYGAYFVQEIIFAEGVFLSTLWTFKFLNRQNIINAVMFGLSAAIAQASKETSVIAFASIFIALAFLAIIDKTSRAQLRNLTKSLKKCVLALAAFCAVVTLAYSSFGENPKGIIDVFRSYYTHFFDKAGMQEHSADALFYIKLLFIQKSAGAYFGEILITLLAVVGSATAFSSYLNRTKTSSIWADKSNEDKNSLIVIFFVVCAVANIFILSLIKYKTPWLILSPMMLLCVPAGFALSKVVEMRPIKAIPLLLLMSVAFFYQKKLTDNAVVRFNSDPRNPFIYSHTVSDEKNLFERLKQCIEFSKYKNDIPIAFVGKVSPWPLPWQLRNQNNVGYWTNTPENINDFDVVITDAFSLADVLKKLDTKQYSSDLFGLRKNTILTVFIKKDIFEKITSQ